MVREVYQNTVAFLAFEHATALGISLSKLSIGVKRRREAGQFAATSTTLLMVIGRMAVVPDVAEAKAL